MFFRKNVIKKIIVFILICGFLSPSISEYVQAYESYDYNTTLTFRGEAVVGHRLTAEIGGNTPEGVVFEWRRSDSEKNQDDGSVIENANDSFYVISNEDIGKCIYVVINGDGINYDKGLTGISRKTDRVINIKEDSPAILKEAEAYDSEKKTTASSSDKEALQEKKEPEDVTEKWEFFDVEDDEGMVTGSIPGDYFMYGNIFTVLGLDPDEKVSWYGTLVPSFMCETPEEWYDGFNKIKDGDELDTSDRSFSERNSYIFAKIDDEFMTDVIGPLHFKNFSDDEKYYEITDNQTEYKGSTISTLSISPKYGSSALVSDLTKITWYEVESEEQYEFMNDSYNLNVDNKDLGYVYNELTGYYENSSYKFKILKKDSADCKLNKTSNGKYVFAVYERCGSKADVYKSKLTGPIWAPSATEWNNAPSMTVVTGDSAGGAANVGNILRLAGADDITKCTWYKADTIENYEKAKAATAEGITKLSEEMEYTIPASDLDSYLFNVYQMEGNSAEFKTKAVGPVYSYDLKIWNRSELPNLSSSPADYEGYIKSTLILNRKNLRKCTWLSIPNKDGINDDYLSAVLNPEIKENINFEYAKTKGFIVKTGEDNFYTSGEADKDHVIIAVYEINGDDEIYVSNKTQKLSEKTEEVSFSFVTAPKDMEIVSTKQVYVPGYGNAIEIGDIHSILGLKNITKCSWYRVNSGAEYSLLNDYDSAAANLISTEKQYTTTTDDVGKYIFAVAEDMGDFSKPYKSEMFGPFVKYNEDEDIPEGVDIEDDLWISDIETDIVYNGKPVIPKVSVYNHRKKLTEKTDYIVTCKDNINAGKATLTVTFTGNFEGQIKKQFTIQKAPLSKATADDIYLQKKDETPLKAVPSVSYVLDGKTVKLKKDKDFTVSYPSTGVSAYIDNGTYDICITASENGNYYGSLFAKEIISSNTFMSKLSYRVENCSYATKTYDKKINNCLIPKITVKGKEELNGYYVETEREARKLSFEAPETFGYDFVYTCVDNDRAGKAKVIFYGINSGDFTGRVEKTFKISGYPIKSATVSLSYNQIPYSGNECRPEVLKILVKDRTTNKDRVLSKEDYEVSYIKNTDAGTASVVIEGKNEYEGKIKKNFTITPKQITEDDFSKISDQIYLKGGCKPSVSSNTVPEKYYSVKYVNNKSADNNGTNKSPKVVIKGKGNYKGTVEIGFDIVNSSLRSLSANSVAPDFVFANKVNKHNVKIVISDFDGKKLTAGKDYSKTIKFVYAENTVVKDKSGNNVIRSAGTEVDNLNDIIQPDTRLTAVISALSTSPYYDKTNKENNELRLNFRCVTKDISKAKVKSVSSKEYTGGDIYLNNSDIVLDGVAENQFVIVGYQNNRKKGTAKVTIRGIGEYGGLKTISFKINAKKKRE